MPGNNQDPKPRPGNNKPKSINFGSIFRRKEDPRPSNEQSDGGILLERFAGRQITLGPGDLTPSDKKTPPLDWGLVNGRITIQASLVEGVLEGRTRIRAQQLKKLDPSPVARQTQDAIEYAVSLAALIPQIEDLLDGEEPQMTQPEFETPFTVLAREDNARFEYKSRKQQSGTPPSESPANGSNDHKPPAQKQILDGGGTEQPEDLQSQNADPDAVNQAQSGPKPEVRTAILEHEQKAPARLTAQPTQGGVEHDRAQQGMEQLQEIFMTSRMLDGRMAASLLEGFPGINGALILLAGGAVLGGKLPESLDVEAALQAPEMLKNFERFIAQVEGTRSESAIFVSVRAGTTISLVASGDIFLVVSHKDKTLPPGVSKRLIETAEALNLIYGQKA